MDLLTYRTHENAARFLPLLHRAAGVWNDVLSDLVGLREWVPPHPNFTTSVSRACNIVVRVAAPGEVRNPVNPDRVAVCQRLVPDYWQISLAPEMTWALSGWNRFWGRGENALTCLIHEIGHVFCLPHALTPDYVMHPTIGGTGKLSAREKQNYRVHFLQLLE